MPAATQGDLNFPRKRTVAFSSRDFAGFWTYVLELSTVSPEIMILAT